MNSPGIGRNWFGNAPFLADGCVRFRGGALLANQWLGTGLVDAGEAEALAHAKVENADLFLTDDAEARALAESIGVESRGTIGVVLFAAAVGKLGEAEATRTLEDLEERSTLWMSSRVKRAAREAIAAIFR